MQSLAAALILAIPCAVFALELTPTDRCRPQSGALCEAARLNGVNWRGAQLSYAEFDRAQLVRARLQRAVMEGADLNNANLLGADLDGAVFAGADMENCIGCPRPASVDLWIDPC